MKVSVVIPGFNAEQTVLRAMQSVLAQTYRDIELIVVDDGSSDLTSEVAKAVARQDARVRVLQQENKGCYEARLAGFAQAGGKYVMSVDADDYIDNSMVEKMVSLAERFRLDVVECDFHGVINQFAKSELYESKQAVYKNVVRPRLVLGKGYMCVCGKMYRNTHDWKQFAHVKTTAFEDIIINAQIFGNVARFGYVHEPLYHYEAVAGSSARRLRMDNLRGLKAAISIRRKVGYGCLRWTLKNIVNILKLAVRSVIR